MVSDRSVADDDWASARAARSGSGLGVTLTALSVGSLAADAAVTQWVALMGIAGAICAIAGGALVVSTISGGPGIWLQVMGFVIWLIWLVAASMRLLDLGGGVVQGAEAA